MNLGVIMKYCMKRKEEIVEPNIKAYCEIIDEYIACVNCVFLKLIENDAQVLAQVTCTNLTRSAERRG